jgi:hypothetical protein
MIATQKTSNVERPTPNAEFRRAGEFDVRSSMFGCLLAKAFGVRRLLRLAI